MAKYDNQAFLAQAKEVIPNLSVRELVEEVIRNGEGMLTNKGSVRVTTGKHTGRSPKDKFIVDSPLTHDVVSWTNNQPCTPETFDKLYRKMEAYVKDHGVYVSDNYAGADDKYHIRVRCITEYAWEQLFCKNLFIDTIQYDPKAAADFTLICLPSVDSDPKEDGVNSDTFIILNFDAKMVLVGGMYAGEMKKSIFSVMNYLLPQQGVMSMHCSCNVGKDGDSAVFFGLSGTGKTTLSADPNRGLIGDDEHGWSDDGVFNIEGGCYAKCIDLSEETEPDIYRAIKFGTVLENVIVDPKTGEPDFSDKTLTENTRAAYPLNYIDNAIIPSHAGHPKAIIFLTCDAFGVLPPISVLTREQAMYHFLAGYTSKVAGTERGITEPTATFSTAFGEPFLPLPPIRYARLLGEKIAKHNTKVYLLNTGWSGGPYGVGSRMKLKFTRAMVTAALTGALDNVEFETVPVFNLSIPKTCPNVPAEILNPINTWKNKDEYHKYAHKLAQMFMENIKKFRGEVTDDILAAGPEVK